MSEDEIKLPETISPELRLMFDELGITDEEYADALGQKEKLAQNGLAVSFSTIEGVGHMGDIWPPDKDGTPKISIEILAPYLPEDLRQEGINARVFGGDFRDEEFLGKKKEEFGRTAKEFVLGIVGRGHIGLELHNETPDAAIDIEHWEYILKVYKFLNNGEIPKDKVTAHLAFLVNRGSDAEGSKGRKDLFRYGRAGITQMLPDIDIDDPKVAKVLSIIWDAPQGYQDDDKRRLNFFTFTPSGQLNKEVRAYLNSLEMADGEKVEIEAQMKEILGRYSTAVVKKQIEAMAGIGAKEFTLHAGDLGTYLTDDEFQRFMGNIKEMASFAKEKGTMIQIETQALNRKQWDVILSDEELGKYWGENLGVTLDVVHVMQEAAIYDALGEGEISAKLGYAKDKFSERMTLSDWKQVIENQRQTVTEMHLSYSRNTDAQSLRELGYGYDDHKPFSQGRDDREYLSNVQPVIQAISNHNRGVRDAKIEGREIKIANESTLQIDDIRFLNEILEAK